MWDYVELRQGHGVGESDEMYVNAYNKTFYNKFKVLTALIFAGEGLVANMERSLIGTFTLRFLPH